MKKIKELLIQHKEILLYVLFGGLTTVVNLLAFHICSLLLGESWYLLSNGIAWFVAVVFAYITNKLWVFESKSWKPSILLREIPSFLGARIFSFLVEEFGLIVFMEWLSFDTLSLTLFGFTLSGSMITKIILAVIVVILNYFFSKLIIFRKKEN